MVYYQGIIIKSGPPLTVKRLPALIIMINSVG